MPRLDDYRPAVFVPAGFSDKKRHYIDGIPKLFYPIDGKPGIIRLLGEIAENYNLGDIIVWTNKELLSRQNEIKGIEKKLNSYDRELILLEQKNSLMQSAIYAMHSYLNHLQQKFFSKNTIKEDSIDSIVQKNPEIRELDSYLITGDSFLLSRYEIKAAYDFLSQLQTDNIWLFTEKTAFDNFADRLDEKLNYKKAKMIFYRHFFNEEEIYARFGGIIKGKAFKLDKTILELIQKLYNNRDSSNILVGLIKSISDYRKEENKFLYKLAKERGLRDEQLKKIKADFIKFVASNSKYTQILGIRHLLMLLGYYKKSYKSFEFMSSVMSSLLNIPSSIVISNIIGNVFDADTAYAAKFMARNYTAIENAKRDFYFEKGFDLKLNHLS